LLAGEVPQEALACEAPELNLRGAGAGPLGLPAEPAAGIEAGQLRVAVVDCPELEPILEACVVEVVLLFELREEPIRLVAVLVEALWHGGVG
jgi:hypothetical protein